VVADYSILDRYKKDAITLQTTAMINRVLVLLIHFRIVPSLFTNDFGLNAQFRKH